VAQGSDKRCRLTAQGIRKLEDALKIANGGIQPSNIWTADTYGLDRGTVADVVNGQKPVTRSSIEKLFGPLDLDLLAQDYEFWPNPSQTLSPPRPNPFEQPGLWGCDELLRRIFERLGQGGSQALIGPPGCGKSEILRAIVGGASELKRPVLSLNMDLVRDERSFFVRLCHRLELEAVTELSLMPMQVERELKRRRQAHVLCLEEIHVLSEEAYFPLSARNWLKGMADAEYPLQLVVASQKELRDLFPDSPVRSSPLADFFDPQTERLKHWSLVEVERFVADKLRGTGVTFTSAQIGELCQESGGRPRDARSAAAKLYDRVLTGTDQV
jgi:hypothetical protein